jgi:hypothetical protein
MGLTYYAKHGGIGPDSEEALWFIATFSSLFFIAFYFAVLIMPFGTISTFFFVFMLLGSLYFLLKSLIRIIRYPRFALNAASFILFCFFCLLWLGFIVGNYFYFS